ncbi:hypothetical protein [Pandoraea apista]|uniref:Glycerophosphoryl diester phosphodiesterase membrane domain-containing protein n=1 Tax=Pandoraea apista TaxID=93218 RepID=A0A5E5P470_9BURK|nr:hypothetical protein [Pandoraea apista]AJF00157.1 hypothetical protein SG18_21810 [Pandoraea apista]AKH74317.1 hypothetical protein XM39_21995 [Pandoraea apista]AKI62865.1 hypothetical protein AA956_15315 [Pandoraea apista]AVF41142.1 hypothetical protein AL486_16630 [Pandoraea apista]OXS88761.1 hypothetical protein B7H01_23945 [Pandoraea apista]
MEPITFKQCFKGAWRDGFNALRNRPLLCLTVAIVMLVTSALSISLKELALTASQNGAPAGFRLRLAVMSFGVVLVNIVAFSVLAVHVVRYTILGPDTAQHSHWYGRDLWRYLWTSIQICVGLFAVWFIAALCAAFALRAAGRGDSNALLGTFFVLLMCALLFVLIRVSLIFPQIGAGRSKRWRAAWQDSRGHFWVMFGTTIGTILPLIVAGVIMAILFAVVLHFIPAATTVVLGTLILQTVLSIAWVAVATSVSGWLYHRFADHLLMLDDAPDDV